MADHDWKIIVLEGAIPGNLTAAQVKEAIDDPGSVSRRDPQTGTMFVIGKTGEEKTLLVILENEPGTTTWRVFTAREATDDQIAFYEKHATEP